MCVYTHFLTPFFVNFLGATPLADISTADVPSRVMRGYRLPQLRVVGDDLYQLMLQCWQLDLDERPTFSEIVNILQNLAENSLVSKLTFGNDKIFLVVIVLLFVLFYPLQFK